MLIIWLVFLYFYSVNCQFGVKLSAEKGESSIYQGYLWTNNKIVFISPELKAVVVKGISISEKICGFELRSRTIKEIPFIVYLMDETSGVGEMKVKPHVYLDYQMQKVYELQVEAFDCDVLPHYSQGVSVKIHVYNESGPVFNNKSFTFSVKKDAKINSKVGSVIAKSLDDNLIEYSIQHGDDLPFEIDQSGIISIRKIMINIKQSDFQIRVVAKEKSKPIEKQSMVFVTIEIQPVCQNKLSDIPDQLDYYLKNGLVNMNDVGQLIQQGHRPKLTICNLPSPMKEVTLKLYLKSKKSSQSKRPICQTDVSTIRIQRGICGANPDTVDLLLKEGGMININGEESVGPEIINGIGNSFTMTWWMKRLTNTKTDIFCFKDDQKTLTISMENCILLIIHSVQKIKIEISQELCQFNEWQMFALTQQELPNLNLQIWIAGSLIKSVTTKINLFQFDSLKLFVGRCYDSRVRSDGQSTSEKGSTRIEVGVISITIEKPQKQDSIECLSSCGEAIITADSITTLSKVSVERKGSSIYLKSVNIPQILDSPMKIQYINIFYSLRSENVKLFEPTDIWMELSIECQSKEIIRVPRAIMRINFIGPQRDLANDTTDVEILSNSTITASQSHFIHIFPNLQFINGNTENTAVKDLKIESCSIRLVQRHLRTNEKIYLPNSLLEILNKNKLETRSNLFSWIIEGEADGIIYETILRQLVIDMVDERKKFSILCVLKNGDFTSQIMVDVIQSKVNEVYYANEDYSNNVHHHALDGKRGFQEKNKQDEQSLLNISKSKFIGVIIMAVIGGAAWALVTAAIACLVLRRKESTINRKRIINSKNYSKNNISCPHQPALVNSHDVFIEYEYEEDRRSMADIPDDEEQNVDNISCDTCNMTDPEVFIPSTKSTKEIPRSKTITFPIIHRKF